jgi:hypothetical protein
MTDKEFLLWMWERLIVVYRENPSYDYMRKLRAIAESIPENQVTS